MVAQRLLDGLKPFSGPYRKNGYPYPDHVHKRGRICSIKDRVCGQQKAAADIEQLIRSRVSFQFLMGNHRVSYKERGSSYPSDRIKPYSIVHIGSLFAIADYIIFAISSAAFV